MREAQSGGKTFFYKDWVTNFRMPKSTFKYICRELEKEIEKNDTVMRLSIPIKMRVICHSLVSGHKCRIPNNWAFVWSI